MTDYDLIDPGANWCPDCGLPRGVCDCDKRRLYNSNDDFDDWGDTPDTAPLCWTCGGRMEWTDDYREIVIDLEEFEEPVYACYNPNCVDEGE